MPWTEISKGTKGKKSLAICSELLIQGHCPVCKVVEAGSIFGFVIFKFLVHLLT